MNTMASHQIELINKAKAKKSVMVNTKYKTRIVIFTL